MQLMIKTVELGINIVELILISQYKILNHGINIISALLSIKTAELMLIPRLTQYYFRGFDT